MLRRLWWWLIGAEMRRVVTDYRDGNGRLYMCDPVTAAIIGATVLGGAGVAMSAISMSNQPKQPDVPVLPSAPSYGESKDVALDAQNKRRRTLLAMGGQTDITQGSANVLSGQTQSKSLLGG